jgi:hypothetical protein
MTRFEYRFLEIPNEKTNHASDILNQAGAEGWEIIAYTWLSGSLHARVLMKRATLEIPKGSWTTRPGASEVIQDQG